MKKNESLPLIQTKNSLSPTKNCNEIPQDSSITNESSKNLEKLKSTMLTTKLRKSISTQSLFLTPKSNFHNSPSTSFLFNGKYVIEKNDENERKNNKLIENEIYKVNYFKKFKKLKTILYKNKFYKNKKIKEIGEEEDKNERIEKIKENEEKVNNEEENEKEENNQNKIDFSLNIWENGINLKNAENFDIGGENNSENDEDIFPESNDYIIPEKTISENNKKNSKMKKIKPLYLTDINNSNKVKEKNINLNYENNTNKNNNNYRKINIIEKGKNPFNFTKYSSLDNIRNFHKLYRNFKNLSRKHFINEKSPSFAFIKSCEKEKVVCNPLGLFKRKGDEHILEMNHQHSGDKYISCLSSSLRFVNHLNILEMSNNNLSHLGVESLFQNIKQNENLLKNLFKLDLSNNKIGEKGIENLLTFIEDKSCQLENLNIEGNNLGDNNINKLCISIAQNIWSRINYFNVGKNKITKNSEKGLLFLVEKCTELGVLILRNNEIDNNLGAKLMIKLKNLYSLKALDISWNLIGNHLVYPFLLEEAVNFYPNQKNLYNNFELDKIKKVMKIDFSRNPLLPKIDKESQGKSTKSNKSKDKNSNNEIIPEIKSVKVPKRKPSKFAIEFSNYIKNNLCPLVHLNISHNNLSYEDCQLISEDSKKNRSILGFHVDGNEMEIDPLGFIHPIKKEEKLNNFYSKSQISFDMENFKGIPKILSSPINKMRGGNNCWICQCWREIEFVLDLKIKDVKPKYTVVKLHLDFENFKPCDMIYKKKCFRLVRMCPPGKVKYFFTFDGNPVKNYYKEYYYKIKEFEKPIKFIFDDKFIEEYNNTKAMLLKSMSLIDVKNATHYENFVNLQEDIRDNDDKLISKTIYVKNYGIRNINPDYNVITQDYQSTLKYSIPRPENISSRKQNQNPWKFSDSIWKECNYYYEGETDEIIEKAFEFDFSRDEYSLTFINENEFLSAKELLKKNYHNFIDCYINLSSYSGSNLWQITSNVLIDWLKEKCFFFDDRYTSQNMIKVIEEIYFIKMDKEDRLKYKTFPSNKYNLIRHTFLALLINISIDKYIHVSGVTNNNFEALKLAFENNFINGMKGYDFHLWRKEKYFNEEIDNYIKAFLPLLDGLYHTFSKKEKNKNLKINEAKKEKEIENKKNDEENNGKSYKEKMTQEDFNSFILTFVNILDYQINDNPLIFHISKQFQIDEITNDDFLYLNLIEFCEALFRVIDIISPAPPEEKIEDWPLEKRKEQLLIEKIENIMPQLYKKIDHPKFNMIRDKFISPLKDQITSLYIIDYKSNMFYNGYEIYFKKDN